MKTYIVDNSFTQMQNSMYEKLNKFARGGLGEEKHSILSRIWSVPVCLIDEALEVVRYPLRAIERIVMAVINVIGIVFSNKYSLTDALFSLESGLKSIALFPVELGLAPLKALYQFVMILRDPGEASSINAYFV